MYFTSNRCQRLKFHTNHPPIGLNCDDWVGTRRQVWRMCKTIYLLMFLIHCTKLQNAIRDEEENSAYTQQVYIVFFVYVTNAAVIYAIKINRKEQDAIRRFVNKRKLRRFDERALKIRTRSFRINTVISLLPLLLTTFDIPMLLISGTLFNAEYALDLQLGEDWELISKLIMAGSLIFLTVFIFITLFTFVYMNSLLSGVIAEAEILGDHFSELEFRVAAKNPMNQDTTSALTTKETYLDLLSWRDELRICVGLQQDFFECILSLKKVSRNISFVQYYVSFLLIADCIMLAMNGINNIFDIGFMFFGLFFVSQCCLMCYWLERLEDEVIKIIRVWQFMKHIFFSERTNWFSGVQLTLANESELFSREHRTVERNSCNDFIRHTTS